MDTKMAELIPLALKDAPALIESVFPAQKVSFEAQKERKAVQSQTLTGLGSYWKGRKPLILVRAIVLGSLLPATGKPEQDLEVFEKLMAFDDMGLTRRALAGNAFSVTKIQEEVAVSDPEYYFSGRSWKRSVSEEEKLALYFQVLETFDSYEKKAGLAKAKRPEEVDQEWLYKPVWSLVNDYYAHLGVKAHSMEELVEQLGILRYGHRPRVGDTFSGGGSIPFEAARMGCDVYASDLNPVACMLTWGALNIVGSSTEKHKEITEAQYQIAQSVDKEIIKLGIEHDEVGNRAKAYLYCLETRCPETGWMIPILSTCVVSKSRNVIVKLIPNHSKKYFDINIISDVSNAELKEAEIGTLQDGDLVYRLEGRLYRNAIRTLRGDFRKPDGSTGNKLRQWEKSDFKPRVDDVFQERLYAIQWITKESLSKFRQETYFTAPNESDLLREKLVEDFVAENLSNWQEQGVIPDMSIESGYNTDQPIRERGWTYWHHLFSPRQLIFLAFSGSKSKSSPTSSLFQARLLDWNSKLCRYGTGAARESIAQTFYNQAFNTFYNYGVRSFGFSRSYIEDVPPTVFKKKSDASYRLENKPAGDVNVCSELWITDPPYADAVNYHEITEFFIAWLRKSPPKPFNEWIWDSRRALAIKGSGDDFRSGMIDAYKAMAKYMPDNGMQCVMFTHQDTGVWSDMVGIFWAAGLQVVAAWYIATETTSELKKGGYVQGTVILMLRKRPEGEKSGFKQRLLPAVRAEVQNQIKTMMHLNEEVADKMGEPVFNDSDLQMAGYAAALKILTAYTHIGGEDVTSFALRPRAKGEVTIVDEIVEQAAEAANSLLVPEGLSHETWQKINGVQRFYMRMMDIETTGVSKLDNYQNFAKAFRVDDYSQIMQSMAANKSRLKRIPEFGARDLSDSTEIGATWLGSLIIGLQQLLEDVEPKVVVEQLMQDLPDFLELRTTLIDILSFIEHKAPDEQTRNVAEIFASRLRNMRALGQD